MAVAPRGSRCSEQTIPGEAHSRMTERTRATTGRHGAGVRPPLGEGLAGAGVAGTEEGGEHG